MNEFQIETAQNVGITQNAADIGDRLLGYLIDSLVIFAYLLGAFLLLIALDLDIRDQWAIYLLISLPGFLYYVLLETFWNGRTIGKYVQRTRVVKLDGSKPNFANYFIRWILRIIDISITSGGCAVLTILIRGNGQRLGDMAAGTTVISERQKVGIEDTLLMDLPNGYVPTYSQVTVLNDKDIQTIKTLYNRAVNRGEHNVILKIASRLQKVMQIEAKENPTDFVAKVILDYNYYTQNM